MRWLRWKTGNNWADPVEHHVVEFVSTAGPINEDEPMFTLKEWEGAFKAGQMSNPVAKKAFRAGYKAGLKDSPHVPWDQVREVKKAADAAYTRGLNDGLDALKVAGFEAEPPA